MKAAVAFCFLAAICAAADGKPEQIPAAAEQIGPGSYRFTDARGAHWLLRKTPFGVAAVEEKNAEIARAFDAGDSVRFVRNTPFGTIAWERKKTELSESEREVWEHQRGRDGEN